MHNIIYCKECMEEVALINKSKDKYFCVLCNKMLTKSDVISTQNIKEKSNDLYEELMGVELKLGELDKKLTEEYEFTKSVFDGDLFDHISITEEFGNITDFKTGIMVRFDVISEISEFSEPEHVYIRITKVDIL